MGEISRALEEMLAFLQARLPQADVGPAYPGSQRPFPRERALVTVGLEQLKAQPLGWGDRGGARRVSLTYRIAICAHGNGNQCLALGEQAAEALMSSPGFFAEEILWGEVKFQREAGGFLLVLKAQCAYVQQPEQETAPPIERVEIVTDTAGMTREQGEKNI